MLDTEHSPGQSPCHRGRGPGPPDNCRLGAAGTRYRAVRTKTRRPTRDGRPGAQGLFVPEVKSADECAPVSSTPHCFSPPLGTRRHLPGHAPARQVLLPQPSSTYAEWNKPQLPRGPAHREPLTQSTTSTRSAHWTKSTCWPSVPAISPIAIGEGNKHDRQPEDP